MKNKYKVKTMLITFIIIFALALIGISYAYFELNIKQTQELTILDTGDLRLRYIDNMDLTLTNALPGDSIAKTFTVENIGDKKVSYNIVWNNLINTINNYDLHLDMKCKSYKNYGTNSQVESGSCDSFYKAVPYTETSISKDIKRNNEIDTGITHEYIVTITFLNRNYDQNDNLGKSFSGKIELEEYNGDSGYCTFDGELVQGAEYKDDTYTYRYMQYSRTNDNYEITWINTTTQGWGVTLTDKTSTEPVTKSPCVYINDIPITYMTSMFQKSQATKIDLSGYNTKNVTSMDYIFKESKAEELDLSSFDTRKCWGSTGMFQNSSATIINTSSFDTSKMQNMNYMFAGTKAAVLDLSHFDTKNFTQTTYMFYSSQVEKLDLSNFNTSNVTNMYGMFARTKLSTLDLSNFDTRKVTSTGSMFAFSNITSIDISNFDTSNVTDMYGMFQGTQLKIINLNHFDTSNVINMSHMFYQSNLIDADLRNFNTSNVTDMSSMFQESKITELDISNFDTNKVTNTQRMFSNMTNLKTIYVSDKFSLDKVTSSADMFLFCENLVGGAGTKYSATFNDKTYARIDGGEASPGYFTAK